MSFGTYKEVMALKAKDSKITGVAQDGGVVTQLLCYAMDKGIIDGALLAGKSDIPWMPKPVIATTKAEIMACAGTKYTINPVVSVLKDAVREHGLEKVAVVGTPCQMYAVQKMKLYPFGARHIPDKIALTVGIFCTENFSYAGLKTVIEDHCKVPVESVTKMEIGKGKFSIKGTKDVAIPIKETHKYEQDSCHVCSDLTAEFADISTGSIGTPDGWSTTFGRSTKGMDLLSKAIADGLFEKKSMDEFKTTPADNKIKSGLDLLGKLEKEKKDKAKKHFDERKALGLFVTPEIVY